MLWNTLQCLLLASTLSAIPMRPLPEVFLELAAKSISHRAPPHHESLHRVSLGRSPSDAHTRSSLNTNEHIAQPSTHTPPLGFITRNPGPLPHSLGVPVGTSQHTGPTLGSPVRDQDVVVGVPVINGPVGTATVRSNGIRGDDIAEQSSVRRGPLVNSVVGAAIGVGAIAGVGVGGYELYKNVFTAVHTKPAGNSTTSTSTSTSSTSSSVATSTPKSL